MAKEENKREGERKGGGGVRGYSITWAVTAKGYREEKAALNMQQCKLGYWEEEQGEGGLTAPLQFQSSQM